MSEKEKIRCGVAGVGYLGQHHARIYNELESCNLVGIFEPNQDAAKKVMRKAVTKVTCIYLNNYVHMLSQR